jgi:hypothetical protein
MTDEMNYEMHDDTKIPNTILFRGYEYFHTSTHDHEDTARIIAMQCRREGDRACVKCYRGRFNNWWTVYTR